MANVEKKRFQRRNGGNKTFESTRPPRVSHLLQEKLHYFCLLSTSPLLSFRSLARKTFPTIHLFFQTNVKILRDLTVQYINIHFNTSLPIKTLNRWKKCWNEIEDKDESEKYDTLERWGWMENEEETVVEDRAREEVKESKMEERSGDRPRPKITGYREQRKKASRDRNLKTRIPMVL